MPPVQFTPPCGLDIAATTIAQGDMAQIASWGYRLVIHESGTQFIHEAYYDADGKLLGFAVAPARPCADSPQELRDELTMMAEALDEPPLQYADYKKGGEPYGRYEGYPDVTDHPGWPNSGDGAN